MSQHFSSQIQCISNNIVCFINVVTELVALACVYAEVLEPFFYNNQQKKKKNRVCQQKTLFKTVIKNQFSQQFQLK
jgi:hypothetical protein